MTMKPQFKIRIVYKSGYTHDFWTWSFKRSGETMTWEPVNNNKPLVIGMDDIAAVWQVGTRYRLRLTS